MLLIVVVVVLVIVGFFFSTLLLPMSLSELSLSTLLLSTFLLFFSLLSLFSSMLVMNYSVDVVVNVDPGSFLSMLSSKMIMVSCCRCCL